MTSAVSEITQDKDVGRAEALRRAMLALIAARLPKAKIILFGSDWILSAVLLRLEPECHLLIDVLPAEQVEVIHGAADPLPVLGKGQR